MLINLKNKDTLKIDCFEFRCCIGKKGTKKEKKEGDFSTPKGIFSIGPVYYRSDRVKKPITSLKTIKIKPKMGWCNEPKSKHYNKKILIRNNIKHEKLFRYDFKYNYLIIINYNTKKIIPNKGSAIFIHLTKNFKPTTGCIALNEKDLLILLKIVRKKTRIKIN